MDIQLVPEPTASSVMIRTMSFPDGNHCRHHLYGILDQCVLEHEAMLPYTPYEKPGTRFSVRSFGVRLSGEPVPTKILKEPYGRGLVEVLLELVIPTISPDRVFDGIIDIAWLHRPATLATGCTASTEPVYSVTIYRMAETSKYDTTGYE
jgi:hypothetical protein